MSILVLCFVKTYIDNTQCEDLQPSHWDSDTLVCERRSGIGHFCHMDHEQCMDPSTGCWCKLCCQGNLGQLCILLGRLQDLNKRKSMVLVSLYLLRTYWEHIGCKGHQWNLVDTCKLLCGCLLCTLQLEHMDCCNHKDLHKLYFGKPELMHIHHQMSIQSQWEQLK